MGRRQNGRAGKKAAFNAYSWQRGRLLAISAATITAPQLFGILPSSGGGRFENRNAVSSFERGDERRSGAPTRLRVYSVISSAVAAHSGRGGCICASGAGEPGASSRLRGAEQRESVAFCGASRRFAVRQGAQNWRRCYLPATARERAHALAAHP